MKVRIFSGVLVGILALGVQASSFAQAPPPPPTPTIWSFMGIPQGMNKLHAQLFNRRGNFPGLEKKPPLKAIADPANLDPNMPPAIQEAAKIKQAEDLAPQKIKAIKFLAKIGCGCYDKDGKVTAALLASMEDCTEKVRLAAIEAIADAAEKEWCTNCKQKSCCNEQITEMLAKIAYERDDKGCYLEPSERVREAAIEALGVCCPGRGPVEPTPAIEGAEPTPRIEGTNTDQAPAPPPTNQALIFPPSPHVSLAVASQNGQTRLPPAGLVSSRRTAQLRPAAPAPGEAASSAGVALVVDAARNLAHVHLAQGSKPLAVGSRLRVYQPSGTGFGVVGELEVTESAPGSANVRPVGNFDLTTISRGAIVVRTSN